MAIKGSRSGLYWRTIPGGLPAIVDVSKIAGDIYFVDSTKSTASDATGSGYHPDKPFNTIDYAVGQCTANQGDHIFVMPGHVETVSAAAGLDLDVAGITIVFAGHGNARGRISFGTAVGADMDVDAADITLINPRFVAAIDALTGPIDVNAARFKLIDGTWEDGATINTTDCVVADANADDMTIDGFVFIDGDAAGTQKQSFIQIAAATRPVLRRIRATGDFGTGVIENGTAWVDAMLEDIAIDNAAAGPVVGILLQATSSGAARKVHVRVASGTTYVTANNDMQWFECYGVGTDAAAGDQIGDTPTASIEGKIDTLQAELSGAAGLTTFPTGAAAANAVSLAEVIRYIQENIITGTGTALPANQSLYDLLAGANGIATWAAAAAPANGVSLAEAVRYIVETLIGTLTNTGGTATLGGMIGDPANSSLVARLTTIAAELSGAAGLTTFPAGAAAANAVSLAEVIRYIQENIIVGTGTALPSNQSLYDLLAGANGIATWPAAAAPANAVSLAEAIRYIVETLWGTLTNTGGTATLGAILGDVANVSLATKLGAADGATTESLHGKLGTDTELADRSVFDLLAGDGPVTYPAAAAPANDVSVAEVLREVYNQADKAISTAAAVMANGDTTVFTIAGGPVEVLGLLSVCVTANDITGSTLQYQADPTDGAVTALSIASASLASAAAGTTALCTGAFGAAPTITANGTVAAGTTKFIVPAGIIKITVATGPTTGTWTHHLRYRPLSRGVTVS